MAAGGPWLTPTEENGPFLEKPPLRSWLVAAPMALGITGPDETGHRVVDAMLSTGVLLFVFLIARRLGGTASGLGAAFLVITQPPLLFVHGLRSGTMEPLLVLAYCAAVHHFLRWAEGDGRRHALTVGAWGAVAVLAKTAAAGPLFVFLLAAAAIVAPWRARARADARVWVRSTLILVAIAAPWFVLQLAQFGPRFFEVMFLEHVVTRVTAAVDPTHLQPWWFYPALVAGTLQWTWPYALGGAAIIAARPRSRRGAALVGLWLLVPLVLFSCASSKLGHYVYPAMPALAVIGGQVFGAFVDAVGDIRRVAPVSRAWKIALALGAAIALAVLLVVAVHGRVAFELGPLHARTARPERPALAAVAALLFLFGRRRGAVALLGLALAASEVDREYGRALERAAVRKRPLGDFVACLAAHSGGDERRIRVAVLRPLVRDERYYFGRVGWREPRELDPRHLTRRVRDPERDTAVVVDHQGYRAILPTMMEWPREIQAATTIVPLRDRDLFVLLPGRFRPCAAAATGQNP